MRGEVCTKRNNPGASKSWDLGYRDPKIISIELWDPNPNWKKKGFGTIRASLNPSGNPSFSIGADWMDAKELKFPELDWTDHWNSEFCPYFIAMEK